MMKRYNSYKDSGVEWIGEIPSHWTKSKLKFVSEIVTGNTPPTKDEDNYEGGQFLWVKPNEINGLTPTNDTNQKLTEKGKSLSRVLPPFSVLVNGIGRIGEFGYSEKSVSTNQQINSIVYNHKVDKRYGLFHTLMMKEGFISNSEKVVVPILNKTKQENIEFIIPPLSEQQQIVSFLDTKTSLIDSLIEKTQRKIELLKEKRTSLINEVVTKGLNPNVEMKDSGVEWIGEIPSHWETKRVKYLIEDDGGIKIGPFGSSLKLDTLTDDGIKVYGQGNVIKDDFTLGHRHIPLERFESDFSQYEILNGDILITMMGTTGKSKVFKREYKRGILDSHLLRLRFKRNSFLSNLFVITLQESDYVFHQLKLNSKGSIMEGLNSSIVKELMLLTPPLSEQNEIVSYLDEQTQLIDNTVSIEEKRIKFLKEYRQSLISEVVTGKQKVVNDE